MPYPIPNTLKTYALAGLMTFVTGLLLGNINSSFAVEPMMGEAGEIEMWVDTSEKFDDEAAAFNNFLNVFTAAFVATGGDLKIVVLDQNTICLSALSANEGCLHDKTFSLNHHTMTDEKNNDGRREILLFQNE